MPAIGKPDQGANPFSNIKKNPGPAVRRDENVGDSLNTITGKQNMNGGVKFVDRRKHNQVGKNEFLELLTFQLANQDPMKPMDQHKFSAELAQFSSLEQLVNLNSQMGKLNPKPEVQDKFYGASFLGKEVMTQGTSVKIDGSGSEVQVPFFVSGNSDKVIVRLMDKKGQMAFQQELPGHSQGNHVFKWDGIGMDKQLVPPGTYKAKVFAWDKNAAPVATEVKSKGIVNGVTFENGETVLWLKTGKKIFLRDVESFNLANEKKIDKKNLAHLNRPEKIINKEAVNKYKNIMN